MSQFNDINEVWKAIESKNIIHWHDDSFIVYIEPYNLRNNKTEHIPISYRNDKCLRIKGLHSGLSSHLEQDEIKDLYIKK